MTTVAQMFVDGAPRSVSPYDRTVVEALALEYTTKDDYAKYADRVVFDENLGIVLEEMTDAGQVSISMIQNVVRLPSDNFWIEWSMMELVPHGRVQYIQRMGVLMQKTEREERPYNLFIVAHYGRDMCSVVAYYETYPPPYADGAIHGRLKWSARGFNPDRKMTPEQEEEGWSMVLGSMMRALIFGLFLIQQPRVIVERKIEHGAALNKKRKKAGKHEMLDYRRIHMRFGVLGSRLGVIRQQGGVVAGIGAGGGRKRYHHVLGHFRCYHRDTPQEHIIWIEPYYRGDPTLGISIKERVLTQQKG